MISKKVKKKWIGYIVICLLIKIIIHVQCAKVSITTTHHAKGMIDMYKLAYEIPIFLKDKKIYEYLSSLIDFGSTNYNDLTEKEEIKLSEIIINVFGNDSIDVLDLDEDDIESNNIEKILHNVYKKFNYDIDQLFIEIIEARKNDIRNENGLFSYNNYQTGELTWRRL